MNAVVKRIYELIAKNGISKTDLANKIGVSKNTIQYWKTANAYPAIPVIERICEVFKITIEQFFSGMETPESNSAEKDFIDAWRMLSDNEKSAILKVMETFKELRQAVDNV